MKTIPNLAPDMNLEILTAEELNDALDAIDFLWIELRKGSDIGAMKTAPEDMLFHLLLTDRTTDTLIFSTPCGDIKVRFEDYGRTWRVWNLPPVWDEMNGEPWKGRAE